MEEPAEDDQRSSEDLIDAFRKRRSTTATAAPAKPEPPAAPAAPPVRPAPAPAPPAATPPTPPAAAPPSPPAPPAVPPRPAAEVVAAPPPVVRPQPPALNLAPTGPVFNLSTHLEHEKAFTQRGSPFGQTAGLLLLIAGLAVLAYERRMAWIDGEPPLLGLLGLYAWEGALIVALIGLAVALAFTWLPGRRVAVPLPASQREAWAQALRHLAGARMMQWTGLAVLVAGALLTVLAYAGLAQPTSGYVATVCALAASVGAALAAWATGRQPALRRVALQSMLLARLEQGGLPGGTDGRVTPVLRALDHLMGALPESAVRRFLASDEAATYLELIDEMKAAEAGPTRDG